MHLLSAGSWPARLLLSTVLTIFGLAALILVGQYVRVLLLILLAPGAVIGIMLLFLGDLFGLAALIHYVGKDGPAGYMLLSVLCMLGFWWLVSFAAISWWMRRRGGTTV
jgi:hypothetical protein